MRVLVADDEKNIRESIKRYLELEGIDAECAQDGKSAQTFLTEETFDMAVVDLRMPGMTGLELLEWIRDSGPAIPTIMISAFGEVNDAVAAMKLGAADYIVKPFDPVELVVRIRRIAEERKVRNLLEVGKRMSADFEELIGQGPAMTKVKALIARIAPTGSSVLITGESGTGKEVIARAIHRSSLRAEGPFTAVNLGGIPETLIESELFGFEKGAFTGAAARKVGMFELASGGTLFLDEIGDLPVHLQVKLLRVIQERKLQRLGGTQLLPIDVRIVAATNRKLEERVKEGLFREDLFYRLNVVRIEVPSLAERREDIPVLAGFLVDKLARRVGKRVESIEDGAVRKLMGWSFPGNVRELENLIERAIIFAEGAAITEADIDLPIDFEPLPDDAPGRSGTAAPEEGALPAGELTLRDSEHRQIVEALKRSGGNRTKAAAALGITRRTLFNKIKEYGLE
ncbi:MAG TPA: sigma-54 dependent transcriptional regulator [Spirochaetia bacterium]|nr:sigma-54 dependent transcriptional regulator [Spirochaetia bacterium]